MNKEEKQRRKILLEEIQINTKRQFEDNLPMSRNKFKKLFDYLDKELSENECDDTNKLTQNYLNSIGQNNIDSVLEWLANNNGYCDCEILANVEELFE
jgi:glutamate/tyrosine decarboxylase-like PLP-dependent enzyme